MPRKAKLMNPTVLQAQIRGLYTPCSPQRQRRQSDAAGLRLPQECTWASAQLAARNSANPDPWSQKVDPLHGSMVYTESRPQEP